MRPEMDDDVIQPVLDLLSNALGTPANLLEQLAPSVQDAIQRALRASGSSTVRVDFERDFYVGCPPVVPIDPTLVLGPYQSASNVEEGVGVDPQREAQFAKALQAAARVLGKALEERRQRRENADRPEAAGNTTAPIDRLWEDGRNSFEPHGLQLIIDSLPAAVLVASAENDQFVLANRQSAALLGSELKIPLPVADLLARYPQFTEDGLPIAFSDLPVIRSLRDGEVVSRDQIQFTQPDGGRVTYAVDAAPLRDDSQRIIAAVVMIQDVPSNRDGERFKDDFIALASHELRTPLTAIHGTTHLLLHDGERVAPEIRRELLVDVLHASRRLNDVIENMLVLATINAGRIEVEREPVSVSQLIDDAIEEVVPPDHFGTISTQVATNSFALGDRKHLSQILRNVLRNAVKYSTPTSPIEVSARNDATMVVIGVRDYGRGFDRETLEDVFQPRGDTGDESLSSVRGLGLGLAVSKQLVEALGGQIWIEQPDTGGALIQFSVPRLVSPANTNH